MGSLGSENFAQLEAPLSVGGTESGKKWGLITCHTLVCTAYTQKVRVLIDTVLTKIRIVSLSKW